MHPSCQPAAAAEIQLPTIRAKARKLSDFPESVLIVSISEILSPGRLDNRGCSASLSRLDIDAGRRGGEEAISEEA